VSKILSPKRVASIPNFCNGWGQRAENMGKGECCSGFSERVCQFISRKSSMTGYTGEKRVGKVPIFQKDIGWRNAGAMERRARTDWESVRKRVD